MTRELVLCSASTVSNRLIPAEPVSILQSECDPHLWPLSLFVGEACTIVLTRRYVVRESFTIPKGFVVRFESGGQLYTAAGTRITIRGHIEAPPVCIFAGAGEIVFMGNTTSVVIPQWWGAEGNGRDDDTSALQAAAAALPRTNGKLRIPKGTYIITRPLRFSNQANAEIAFEDGAWLRQEAGSFHAITIADSSSFKLRNARIFLNTAGATGAVLVTGSPDCVLDAPVVRSLVPVPAAYVPVCIASRSHRTIVLKPVITKLSASLPGAYLTGVLLSDSNDCHVIGGKIGWAVSDITVEASDGVSMREIAAHDVHHRVGPAESRALQNGTYPLNGSWIERGTVRMAWSRVTDGIMPFIGDRKLRILSANADIYRTLLQAYAYFTQPFRVITHRVRHSKNVGT